MYTSILETIEGQLWQDVDSLNQEHRMALKLQGVASKMALLQHNVDADADKLGAAIDAADAKRQVVMPKAVAAVSATTSQLADVESFVASIEQMTNGAPTIEEATALPPAGPYPTYP